MLHKLWHAIRRLSGDDAYERYLAHHSGASRHSHAVTPRLVCASAAAEMVRRQTLLLKICATPYFYG